MPGGEGYRDHPPAGQQGEEEDVPDVSLNTGRIRTAGQEVGDTGELADCNQRTVAVLHQGGGGQFLASREGNSFIALHLNYCLPMVSNKLAFNKAFLLAF